MGPVLLQEEIKVPGENLRCLVVKLDNNLLTCGHGNFNQITARRWNQTLVTVVRDTCTTILTAAPHLYIRMWGKRRRNQRCSDS